MYKCELDNGRSTRKLLTEATFTATATTATITSSKSSTVNGGKPEVKATPNGGQSEGKNDKFSVEKLENSGKDEYQDIMDIAGMDYSTARRKSPIHN
ncbi:hypothetical protein Sjap_019351 [Stephania japonica]|uniref:Uncharacterized protein n=1 Tax=Stephania japonica TaxID=461633 RepID=A0AAP0F1F3_9MAGN